MSATPQRRARDPAQDDAAGSSQPATPESTQPYSDSEGLGLKPERRWAQLGAARMAPPPASDAVAPSVGPEAAPEDPPVHDDDSSALSRPVTQIAIGSIVGAAVVVMIMAVNGRVFPIEGGTADGAVPAASLRATTTPAATMAVGGVSSLRETFDDLPINSALPGPWKVTGQGTVAIVALPTSVDRSVRITSTASGGATALCRPTGIGSSPTALRVAFDYLPSSALGGEMGLVTLQTGGDESIELLIGPGGAPVGVKGLDGGASASSPPPLPPSPPAGSAGLTWQHLVIDVDPRGGSVSWVAHDASGAETASGSATGTVAREALETICLQSPTASAGWIAIDDLIIEG